MPDPAELDNPTDTQTIWMGGAGPFEYDADDQYFSDSPSGEPAELYHTGYAQDTTNLDGFRSTDTVRMEGTPTRTDHVITKAYIETNAEYRLSSTLVDLRTAANTTLFTVPSGQSYNISAVVLIERDIAGTPSAQPAVAIEVSGQPDQSMFYTQTLIGVTGNNHTWTFRHAAGQGRVVVAGEVISIEVKTAATGYTAFTMDTLLYGMRL